MIPIDKSSHDILMEKTTNLISRCKMILLIVKEKKYYITHSEWVKISICERSFIIQELISIINEINNIIYNYRHERIDPMLMERVNEEIDYQILLEKELEDRYPVLTE